MNDELFECDLCKGTGIFKHPNYDEDGIFCKKCKGTRKLNWLEIIFGKKELTYYEYYERHEYFSTGMCRWL